MKKNIFLLLIVLLAFPGSDLLAFNKGYEQLDKLFIFAANNAFSCYKFDCNNHKKLEKKVAHDSDFWKQVFHILDKYHIDPNTYYFKKLERETLLDVAVSKGDIQVIEILLDKYKMRITDNTLLIAVEKERSKALKFLLQQGGRPSDAVLQSVQGESQHWARRIFSRYGFKL